MLKKLIKELESMKEKVVQKYEKMRVAMCRTVIQGKADLMSDAAAQNTTDTVMWIVIVVVIASVAFAALLALIKTDILPQVGEKIKNIFNSLPSA